MTLSRLLTVAPWVLGEATWVTSDGRTIEAANDGFSVTPLPHYELDMGVFAREFLNVVVDECAEVGGGCPVVTVLEDQLANLRNESAMAVGMV